MGGHAHTVLIVDDDESLRMLCRVNLQLESYRVFEAGSLAEARDVLGAEPIDVVLLDIHVGRDDGRDLLEQIRSDWPTVTVALFTGSAEVHELSGADAILPKPFALDALTTTVNRLAALSR